MILRKRNIFFLNLKNVNPFYAAQEFTIFSVSVKSHNKPEFRAHSPSVSGPRQNCSSGGHKRQHAQQAGKRWKTFENNQGINK